MGRRLLWVALFFGCQIVGYLAALLLVPIIAYPFQSWIKSESSQSYSNWTYLFIVLFPLVGCVGVTEALRRVAPKNRWNISDIYWSGFVSVSTISLLVLYPIYSLVFLQLIQLFAEFFGLPLRVTDPACGG